MEILHSFFGEVNSITSENITKGLYSGEYYECDQMTLLISALNGNENKYANVVKDVDWEMSSNSILKLKEKLLSLNSIENRTYYAIIYATELDANLFNAYMGLSHLKELNYSVNMIKRSIREFVQDSVDSFAVFDVDLVEYLKRTNGDFEMEFEAYDEFRANKFVTKINKASLSAEKAGSNTGKETSNSDIEPLSYYLKVKDKDAWLLNAHSLKNYQELADFLGIEVALEHITRIPSKKGGGLFNLACIEFPEILNYKNEKERRVLRNAVNNAVTKHRGYNDIYTQK